MRTNYVAVVAVEATSLGSELADETEALAKFDPIVSQPSPGLLQVRLTVCSDSLTAACSTAIAVATAATGAPAVAAHIETERLLAEGSDAMLVQQRRS